MYYNITGGNEEGKFVINGTTGVVETASSLDRETTGGYVLTVTAYDGSLPPRRKYAHGKLTVTIEDVNDNRPEIVASSLVVIPENFTAGDVLTNLSATDSDAGLNAQVMFEIRDGNSEGWFTLNQTTGEISLNGTWNTLHVAL